MAIYYFCKKGIEYNNTIIIIEIKMKTKLIESLDFTEEEYNEKTAGEDIASFNEFIEAVIAFVEQSGGTLEDAIVMANEAYYQLILSRIISVEIANLWGSN